MAITKTEHTTLTKNRGVQATFQKAVARNSEWLDKDEFLDVIYWARQIIGIILGVIWGLIPIYGVLGILLFGVLNSAFVYVYCSNYQQIDDEEYGGIWEILKEGFMTSFAGFLVVWIIFYSAFHFN